MEYTFFAMCSDTMFWADKERARAPGSCVRAGHPTSAQRA